MSSKKMMLIMITMMVMGMVMGQDGDGGSGAAAGGKPGGGTTPTPIPFTNCYSRCFFFCMIEPQNLCSCTSICLKKCLDLPPATTMDIGGDGFKQNLGFCKLGCATSSCSSISTLHNPDVEGMGRCVDSCSTKCTMSY